jgi:hypothetical protein
VTFNLFHEIDRETDGYRKSLKLAPLVDEEVCEQCGRKGETYLSLCNPCYHSTQISSREEHSPVRREDD